MKITDCPDGFVAEIQSEEDFIAMMKKQVADLELW